MPMHRIFHTPGTFSEHDKQELYTEEQNVCTSSKMASQQITKSLICLWKGCDDVFEEAAAFKAHIDKHYHEQMQTDLDNQGKDGTEEQQQDGPLAKKAKLNEGNVTNGVDIGKRKILMAVEVWTDVLGFVKRIQLAHVVSLTNWHIHDICWPRLHGNKVMAHEVANMTIASRDDGWSTTPILLIDERKEVPFANCPPPAYITEFNDIKIKFLDHQVLAFIKLIAPRLTEPRRIDIVMQMEYLDEQQRGFINQLLNTLREETPNNHIDDFATRLDNIPFLPDMDNRTTQSRFEVKADTDIPLLVNWLATPRSDGQQRVMWLYFDEMENENDDQLATQMAMVNAIKQNFLASTQPLPQPFYICCEYLDPLQMNNPECEEENEQTGETLTITLEHLDRSWLNVYRHPKGQHEQWAEDAQNRMDAIMTEVEGLGTKIYINL